MTDWDEESRSAHHDLHACIPFTWRDCTINLIDTPATSIHRRGRAQPARPRRCIVVFDAQKGVEAQSETVWRQANSTPPAHRVRQQMDVVGANFAATRRVDPQASLGRPVSIGIPIGAGSPKDSDRPFEGVIDLIAMKAMYFDADDMGKDDPRRGQPEDMAEVAQAWREKLFDALTERMTRTY